MSTTTTTPEPGTKETVSYPLESTILAILTGARKVDLTATVTRLAGKKQVLNHEDALFVLPDNLQHLFALIDDEVREANRLVADLESLLGTHAARHEEEGYDGSDCDTAQAAFSELHDRINKHHGIIESHKSIFWAIVNEMAGDPDESIRIGQGFAVIKKGDEAGSLIDSLVQGGLGSLLSRIFRRH